ncbi:DNA-binding transcriptional LysR family regulator [Pseudomonas duriflava]|uniref:DNA-binding transcriptional LysR family regulator n=1 Tax=Pseudomonas duriflava TaxID=459528 RepID=A0A562QA88_9PSED|nr:LysR family transcriptional regulator [Pseudomonas duriflava]TWI53080.1 DNA-binding transcriptional LysR family regulator [Pseudomonas duriflava]
MDLSNLKAFIAVAEMSSFSEAGERLHLTQPAISKRIASLEQDLGTRLFDRIGREISLTEAGRALLPRAYQIQEVLTDTRKALTNLSGEVSGKLTFATSHHIGLHRLPPVLRAFTRRYPSVALDIRFLDSEAAYEEILQGRVELAIITLAPEKSPLIQAVPVWDDPLDFVAAPEHPLALAKSISLTDVAQYPAVFPGGNTFTHHIVRRLFEARQLSPNIAMSTNYLETIKMMVSIGIAWSVLPRTMLDDQVMRLPLPGLSLKRQLGYIVHTERTHSNAARALMSLLDEEAS